MVRASVLIINVDCVIGRKTQSRRCLACIDLKYQSVITVKLVRSPFRSLSKAVVLTTPVLNEEDEEVELLVRGIPNKTSLYLINFELWTLLCEIPVIAYNSTIKKYQISRPRREITFSCFTPHTQEGGRLPEVEDQSGREISRFKIKKNIINVILFCACDVGSEDSWIYAYNPETKQQSRVWVFQDEPNPKKVIRAKSTLKQMIPCFFGQKIELTGRPPYSPDLAPDNF
ncbi:hypothetical protein EVAR_79762_1 [Eumeta japonica]|uniref:Mariner Mos1 transposase n=1 Tax=Eumeta variegata TaxID=151549 RepID=A0A4C1T9B1_EUMVA|nr:hypothetical protein EVAR_79762_1 [Eumeta japonica]